MRPHAPRPGDFEYDASNVQKQSTYALADFRAGIRGQHWFAEGWANNAFDSHYVPIAIPFGTASGYVGESGDPVTFAGEHYVWDGKTAMKIDKPDDAEVELWDDQILITLRKDWTLGSTTWPAGSTPATSPNSWSSTAWKKTTPSR